MRIRAFENDTVLADTVRGWIYKHLIQSVVETGTEYGGTANALAQMPPVLKVFTFDIEQKFPSGSLHPNVRFFKQDSRTMDQVIRMTVPTLFYLDAHTSNTEDECPLRAEVQSIVRMDKPTLDKNAIYIIVHDCIVPGANLGYDEYKDGPISYQMIQDLLPGIFPKGHHHWYNDNSALGARRGVLFIEPI